MEQEEAGKSEFPPNNTCIKKGLYNVSLRCQLACQVINQHIVNLPF
jgi:hypothetical protein